MRTQAVDGVDAVLAGVPVVYFPVEDGTHVRRSDHTTVLRDGTPMPLQTDAPDSAVADCGGWWPLHLLHQHLRGRTACPPGIHTDPLDQVGRRWLVTGPGGQIVVERVSRHRP